MDTSNVVVFADWSKLCDALGVSPDATIDHIVAKALRLQELLTECRHERHAGKAKQ